MPSHPEKVFKIDAFVCWIVNVFIFINVKCNKSQNNLNHQVLHIYTTFSTC